MNIDFVLGSGPLKDKMIQVVMADTAVVEKHGLSFEAVKQYVHDVTAMGGMTTMRSISKSTYSEIKRKFVSAV